MPSHHTYHDQRNRRYEVTSLISEGEILAAMHQDDLVREIRRNIMQGVADCVMERLRPIVQRVLDETLSEMSKGADHDRNEPTT